MTSDSPIATEGPTAGRRAFLSLSDAAEYIGCTRRFLETRVRDGELKVFRPSSRLVRVSQAELDRWIEAFSHGGVNQPSSSGTVRAA